MGIGISIILIVIGLVLVLNAVDLPSAITDHVATDTVGWICLLVGVIGIVVAIATMRRSREHHIVEERRY